MDSEVVSGAIVIFYREGGLSQEYLLVKNSKTGNVTFVGGAQEGDESLEETAAREIKEELGLDSGQYELISRDVRHEFVFGSNKVERAGQKGVYQVFLAHGNDIQITPTVEIKEAIWRTKEEVMNELTFEDLKDIFNRAVS